LETKFAYISDCQYWRNRVYFMLHWACNIWSRWYFESLSSHTEHCSPLYAAERAYSEWMSKERNSYI